MTVSTLEVQKALIALLKADAGVSAIVGARIYDAAPQDPTYPLITLGDIAGRPWEGSGMDGWEDEFTVDIWSEKPGKPEALQIAAASVAAIHRAEPALTTQQLVMASLMTQRAQLLEDGVRTLVRQKFRFRTHP
jgi:uncharacterized protein (DUF1800 family)